MHKDIKIIVVLTNMALFLLFAFHVEVWAWLTTYIAAHGWLFFISQVAITLVGVPAIYISQSLDLKTRRWASVMGLCGQPFWYMMAYATSGWGVFIMSLFYTAAWWRGFSNYWLTHPVDESELLVVTMKDSLVKLSNAQLQYIKRKIDDELAERVADEI